jgi:ABC-type multidrug transport system ATPase subunit
MVLTTPKMTATTPAAVEASGLSKTYGATRAVRGLSLRVEAAGQVFGFLGPNGAGKTTTIRMLLALQQPTGSPTRFRRKEGRPAESPSF